MSNEIPKRTTSAIPLGKHPVYIHVQDCPLDHNGAPIMDEKGEPAPLHTQKGHLKWILGLEILDGDARGRCLRQTLSFGESALPHVKRMYVNLGLAKRDQVDFVLKPEQLDGLRCWATCVEYNADGYLQVDSYAPMSAEEAAALPSAMIEYALAYAKYGMWVFPCYEIDSDHYCSCGATGCKSPGKHPRFDHWQELATIDEAQIKRWWTKWPTANIGVLCGEKSNLTVLDDDGEVGRAQLREFEIAHSDMPQTPHVLTGGGYGDHYYFEYVPGLLNAVRFAPGLDICTEGGFVVGVGSRNARGPYVWEVSAALGLEGLQPGKMPDWLIEKIKAGQPGSRQSNGGKVELSNPVTMIEGAGRHNELWRAGRSLKAQKFVPAAIRAALDETNRSFRQPLETDEYDALTNDILTRADTAEFQASHSNPADDPENAVLGDSETLT